MQPGHDGVVGTYVARNALSEAQNVALEVVVSIAGFEAVKLF